MLDYVVVCDFPVPEVPSGKTVVGNKSAYYKRSTAFMLEDLAKSGLSPDNMCAHADIMPPEEGILASYTIPYFDYDGSTPKTTDGQLAMWRRRRLVKAGLKLSKYTQQTMAAAEGYASLPYLPPPVWKWKGVEGLVLHICEGEKKTAAVTKWAEVCAIGIGGKDVSVECRDRIRWVISALGATSVCLWPDADIGRYDVLRSYGVLKEYLERDSGVKVRIMQPGWDTREHKGIDDALAAGIGWEEVCSGGEILGMVPLPAAALAERYGLQFKSTDKGGTVLKNNEFNYMKLLRSADLWNGWWVNEDTRSLMHGDEELSDTLNAVTMCADFQSRLCFPDATVDKVWRCICTAAEENMRSPWRDWLNERVWDGKDRLSGWMSERLGCERDSYSEELGTKFLCAVVARTFKPGVAVDWMLILHGAQGVGKSSLPAALLGEWSGLTRFSSSSKEKDLMMLVARSRIINFDEMSVFFTRQEENEHMKEMVTRTTDSFRVPYGRETKDFARGCVLYGSTNKPDLIKYDPSGYRRWAMLTVEGVKKGKYGSMEFDWEWINENREQMWAQAVSLVHGGISVAQITQSRERAKAYVTENPVTDQLISALSILLRDTERLNGGELPRTKEGLWFINTGALVQHLSGVMNYYANTRNVARFWEQWGCERVQLWGHGRVWVISAKLEQMLRT